MNEISDAEAVNICQRYATALTDIQRNLSSNVADISPFLDIVPHFLQVRHQRDGYNKCQDRKRKFPEAVIQNRFESGWAHDGLKSAHAQEIGAAQRPHIDKVHSLVV